MKTKTASWITWFDGTELDARLAIILCLAMIEDAQKEIEKEHKNENS